MKTTEQPLNQNNLRLNNGGLGIVRFLNPRELPEFISYSVIQVREAVGIKRRLMIGDLHSFGAHDLKRSRHCLVCIRNLSGYSYRGVLVALSVLIVDVREPTLGSCSFRNKIDDL